MSDTYWLVAKYMPDLRRREPRNVGVVVVAPDGVVSRFKGERIDGHIDGRSARMGMDLGTYRAWIDFWRHELDSPVPEEEVETLLRAEPDQQLLLEFGGRVVYDEEPSSAQALLDEIYPSLVDEPDAGEAEPPIADLSSALLQSAGIADKVTPDFKFESRVKDRVDIVRFDYRYSNGRVHLLQNVSLSLADERSWQSVHAAAWSFERAHSEGFENLVALVKVREPDEAFDYQFRLIEGYAYVVDVGAEASPGLLREVLAVS